MELKDGEMWFGPGYRLLLRRSIGTPRRCKSRKSKNSIATRKYKAQRRLFACQSMRDLICFPYKISPVIRHYPSLPSHERAVQGSDVQRNGSRPIEKLRSNQQVSTRDSQTP